MYSYHTVYVYDNRVMGGGQTAGCTSRADQAEHLAVCMYIYIYIYICIYTYI